MVGMIFFAVSPRDGAPPRQTQPHCLGVEFHLLSLSLVPALAVTSGAAEAPREPAGVP